LLHVTVRGSEIQPYRLSKNISSYNLLCVRC